MAKGSKQYTMWVELRGATEKFTQDMNSAVGKITKVEKQMTGVARNIQRAFQAAIVVGGIAAVRSLAGELGKLAEEGEKAGSVEEGFKRLGGSATQIAKARQAVLGMVDSFDLMQIASSGLVKQLPGFNENFGKIAELGARLANTLNLDTRQAIQRVTDAIGSGNTKQLEALGIMVNAKAAYEDYAARVGKSTEELSKQERRQAIAAAATASLEKAIARLAPVTDSVANSQTALSVALSEAYKQIGIQINNNPALIESYRELAGTIQSVDWVSFGQGISSVITLTIQLINLTAKAASGISTAYGVFSGTGGVSGQISAARKQASDMASKFRKELEAIDALGRSARTPQQLQAVKIALADFAKANEQMLSMSDPLKDMWLEQSKALHEYEKALVSAATGSSGGAASTLDKANKVIEKTTEEQKLATLEVANDLYEKQVQAYRDGVNEWQSLFENAITGVTFDLKDTLRQVAVGFAAEIAQAVFGSLGDIGGAKGIGGAIARGLLGESLTGAGTSLFGGGDGLLGALGVSGGISGIIGSFGMSGAAASSAGLAGPLTAGGMFTPASGILGALGPWGVGGLAALGIGGAMFGSKLFGHGPKNPDTIARRKASEWIEGITGQNFVVGSSSKFNTESGFAALHKLDKEAQGVFMALGQSIKSTLGITEDITEQIATLLVENTGEGIDKAKAMWQSLGLNAEEVQQKIIQDMIKAGKTWLEIESILSQVDRLSTPGMDQKGDFVGAFQAIIDSNATGLQATNAVITNAIEAAEANFKTFEEWKNALKQHFDPAQVDIFFQALAQRGVSDFKTLQDASIRTAGAIISDMQALGFAFEDVTRKIQEAASAVNTMTGGVSELPSNIAGTEIPKLARGGIVTRPTLAVVGEAGPEIVMPMARFSRIPSMSGRGGGQGITVHIDARGAGPGVERNLMRVMREISEQSVARGINQLVRVSSRGGRGGL